MAIAKTNSTSNNTNPQGTSITFSYNHPTGSNWLVIVIASPTASPSSVTFNGQAMTSHLDFNTLYSTYWRVFAYNMSSNTGTHNVVISYSSAQWNPVVTAVFSFSGANGIGTVNYNNTQGTNQTVTLANISTNAMVIANCIGGNNTNAFIEIPDGTVISPLDYNQTASNGVWGACAKPNTTGNVTIQGGSTASNIILGIEVEETVVVASRRIFVI